jgi:hypothetical protein
VKKLLLLLILSFFSAQSFASSCPDGSEPIKSVSEDGTYFVYNCGTTNLNSNAGTVKVSVQESTSSGNWFLADALPMYSPHYAKQSQVLRKKSYTQTSSAFADFDGDGIEDLFILTNPKQPGVVWDEVGPECNTSFGACYTDQGSISVFKVEKSKYFSSSRFIGTDVTGLLFSDNPIEMNGTDSTDLHLADFNGDGKVDVFATDTTSINMNKSGKNDVYFLSNEEGVGWTESTRTHVTGTGVRKGKGLINFSHGSSIGDIDGDGDIDIVVTSINWRNNNTPGENGEIWCYVNQGDGHMRVRRCGNQWGKTAELGDIDNDGDLDIVWGSETLVSVKYWNRWNRIPGCFGKSRCNGTFNGILLNDGTGNFYERGSSFPDEVKNSSGHAYYSVPAIAIADLDGDGDLDVVRMHVGQVYAGAAMTIEENIGNGKFRTVLYSEFCPTPKTKEEWPRQEGSHWNCWVSDYKFGDFNKDGLIDIYLDGHDANRSDVVQDGAIYMSTGKFTYDILLPKDKDYPLLDITIKKQSKFVAKVLPSDEELKVQQSVEDEIAAFEAELAAELGQ